MYQIYFNFMAQNLMVGIEDSAWPNIRVLRFYRVTGTSLQFPKLKSLIVIISAGCLLCAVLFLLCLSFLLEVPCYSRVLFDTLSGPQSEHPIIVYPRPAYEPITVYNSTLH
ncbi:hypothetical protein FF38_14251 [Lucilia cuprina]|uniref:Uncharacterized protein n=1 Tax=Lucilia cuprina TaxID=7375 RepID=A0A0L0BT09_LUCCU|nr:hypothetical protein FF38_14251 [Lucilia cuprina]